METALPDLSWNQVLGSLGEDTGKVSHAGVWPDTHLGPMQPCHWQTMQAKPGWRGYRPGCRVPGKLKGLNSQGLFLSLRKTKLGGRVAT